MELAVNTFEKGLQMDTNPMVQGNKTLSNALNATFVTMNGNEVILQNDMGNRRVDNAYLPSGYEPVGIKEHGGIIYLALYNPITNKGQIGSFPSPQLRFNSTINLEITVNIEDKKFLTLIKLTDLPLYVGDNFLLDWKNTNELNNCDEISNAYNTKDGKVYSPKNKLYTYSLGVINSLNLFIDITNTLKRYEKEEENPNTYDDSISDLYKFNDGYFIRNIILPILSEELQEFPENINIYSYKLVGPLYLKIYINHILDFSYSIEDLGVIEKDSEKYLVFSIHGNIIYNCPDGSTSEDFTLPIGDDTYFTYENFEVEDSDIFGYDLFINNEFIDEFKENIDTNNNNIVKYPVTYNKESNVYNTTIIKKYKIELGENTSNDIVNYTIKVKAPKIINEEKWYIEELEDLGTIDLSLIGTNNSYITLWRYKYKEKTEESEGIIDLIYTLSATPISGKEYSNVHISLIDVTDSKEYKLVESLEQPFSSGRKHILATLTDFIYDNGEVRETISEQSLYKVKLYYEVSGEENKINVQDKKSTEDNSYDNSYLRWILTTPLFNDCYNNVLDFGHIVEDGSKLSEKLTIVLSTEGKITPLKGNLEITTNGSLLNKNEFGKIEYEYKSKLYYEINYPKQFELNNPTYYPSYLSLENTKITVNAVEHASLNNNNIIIENTQVINNKISTTITTIDKFTANEGEEVLMATNVFDKIRNCEEIFFEYPHVSYSGIYMDVTTESKWYKFAINSTSKEINPTLDSDEATFINPGLLSFEIGGHYYIGFGTENRLNQYLEKMNTDITLKALFCYLGIGETGSNTLSEYRQDADNSSGCDSRSYSRVWWRNSYGNWTILRGIFKIDNIKEEILEKIDRDNNIVYRAYNSKELKKPQNIEVNDFFTETIKYNLTLQNNLSLTLDDSAEKILKFKLPSSDTLAETFEITVNSSEQFQEDVNSIILGNVDGVCLINGSLRDSLGNKIGFNGKRDFYRYKNGSLVYGSGIENKLKLFCPLLGCDYNLIQCIPTKGNRYENQSDWYPYLSSTYDDVKGGLEFKGGNITTIGWEELSELYGNE